MEELIWRRHISSTVLAYSAQAWRGATLRVTGSWPYTAPEDHLDRGRWFAWMEDIPLIYLNLHGFQDQAGWYGQGYADWGATNIAAILPDDLELLDLEGAIVLASVCWSDGSPMEASFINAGAACFVGYQGEPWGGLTPRSWAGSWNIRLGPADRVAKEFIRLMKQGAMAGPALRRAKTKMLDEVREDRMERATDTVRALRLVGDRSARLKTFRRG